MSQSPRRLTVGSLFSGIGGFDLGFERAGFEIRWQVEIDPFCLAVLAEHWPEVKRYTDVRMAHAAGICQGEGVEQHAGVDAAGHSRPGLVCGACLEAVDVICGGFPCQPHSLAGRRLAGADDRDLWPHFARIIRESRPRWVVAENVPGLLSSDAGRFFGTVLGDLAACGYDAEWDCLPASAFGAPHQRDRVWLVGQPVKSARGILANSVSEQFTALAEGARGSQEQSASDRFRSEVSDSHGSGLAVGLSEPLGTPTGLAKSQRFHCPGWERWAVEPDVGRVAYGVPARVDRLRGLGNAIVPQIAQWIAERIKAVESISRWGLSRPPPEGAQEQ